MPILPPEPSRDATPAAFLRQFDHDLRTPLGTIAAAIELLRDEPPGTDTHAGSIAVLERQVARLHALAGSLRTFARRLDPHGDADAPDDDEEARSA